MAPWFGQKRHGWHGCREVVFLFPQGSETHNAMPVTRGLFGASLTAALVATLAAPAAADGTVTVENRSDLAIKVAGEGGGARVDKMAEDATIAFEGGKDVGIDLKIWWVSKPRELCQLFVPWDRTVVVSGTATIRCRSE